MDAVRRFQKKQLKDDFEIEDVSPFSAKILAKYFSDKFKMSLRTSIMERLTHVANFHTNMLLQNIKDMVL